jgi:hypothetical protein
MKTKTSDKVFKMLVAIIIVCGALAIILNAYNKHTINKAINAVVEATEEAFNTRADYSKGSNRIIVKIYNLENEEELFNLTKDALPLLSPIGEYDIVNLLSVRTYYKGNKDDFQFYDVKFKDINKIEWDKINNFDDFLTYLNVSLD